ncbi:Curcuminoid synthase [Hordeum vulgare]|nr:Curcuminoid synthase [Hordeum vulgare]
MVSASQTTIPGTHGVLNMQLKEAGLDGHIFHRELVPLAAKHIGECLTDAFKPLAMEMERPVLCGAPWRPWNNGPHRQGSLARTGEAGGEPDRFERVREHAWRNAHLGAR